MSAASTGPAVKPMRAIVPSKSFFMTRPYRSSGTNPAEIYEMRAYRAGNAGPNRFPTEDARNRLNHARFLSSVARKTRLQSFTLGRHGPHADGESFVPARGRTESNPPPRAWPPW